MEADRDGYKQTQRHPRTARERSVTPLVGIILLFGLVMVSAALLAVTGMALIDALESESERDQTETCLKEAEHRISTVASYGTVESLPCDGGEYVDDGEVYLVWYGEGTVDHDDPEAGDVTSVTGTLGAIEFSGGDRTYAYQSGGTWEVSDDYTRVISGPDVRYEDDVRINVLTIDEDDLGNDVTRVSRHADGTLADDIQEAQRDARSEGHDNLSLVIASDYHDGWADHLTETMVNENASVTHYSDDRIVQVDITNATTSGESEFVVTEDKGLQDNTAGDNVFLGRDTPGNPNSGLNNNLNVSATVENLGHRDGTEDVTFELIDPDIDISEESSVSLDGEDENEVEFDIPVGPMNSEGINFGEVYQYDVTPEVDENGLNTPGSFYVAIDDDPYLDVRNPRINDEDASDGDDAVPVEGENITLAVDVHNIGATNATDQELELQVEADEAPEADPYGLTDEENPTIDRSVAENETASWEINGSKLLEGEHTFSVTAVDSGEITTGQFDVEDGIDVGETDLVLPNETDVNVSIIGSELSRHGEGFNAWLPSYVNVFTQPVDENGESIDEPERHEEMDWVDTNINRQDERLTIYDYEFTTDERVSLMLQSTSYLDCSNWRNQGEIDGYDIYDCETGDEVDELVDLTAETDTEESNVRVLNETRNTMPELEPGVDVQLRADELLQREGVDIEVTENDDEDVYDGEGYDLHLEENEFVFLFELTHHPDQYNVGPELDEEVEWTNERYWEEAFDRQGGDPNFNDVIAHVEVDPPRDGTEFGFESGFEGGDGSSIDFGPGDGTESGENSDDDSGIDVGGDEIIIG